LNFTTTVVLPLSQIGLWGSCGCVGLFAYAVMAPVSSTQLSGHLYYLFLWLLHGLFQSTGGPVNTAIMSNWFPAKNRGFLFGMWTCHQVCFL
jgi:sugar phosphate permease